MWPGEFPDTGRYAVRSARKCSVNGTGYEVLKRHGAGLNQTAQQRRQDGSFQPMPGMTPLATAIEHRQWDTMAFLVSMGADVRARGGQYLAAVAVSGPVDMITKLLDTGVDVSSPNGAKETALMAAVRSERQDRVQLLLDHGADQTISDGQGTDGIERIACEHDLTDWERELQPCRCSAGGSGRVSPSGNRL
jgi:ankyrin repeat protein